MERPLYIASCSFGKDSLATILLANMHNEPLDRIVFAEVMYDHKRNISGEIPEHIEWIRNTAIPTLQGMGYKVDIVRAKTDYLQEFFKKRGDRTKDKSRVGKYQGFLIGGMCRMNGVGKVQPMHDYYKQFNRPVVQYIGIAIDEEERLSRIKGNKVSLLAKYGYTEKMAYNLCKQYNLLSPIYTTGTRGGCWFCPNAKYDSLCVFKREHADLWGELVALGSTPNLCSYGFKYGKTIEEVDKKLQSMERQLTLF